MKRWAVPRTGSGGTVDVWHAPARGQSPECGRPPCSPAAAGRDQADIEPVMEQLRQYGFVDDAKFAEHFASARRDSGSCRPATEFCATRQRRISSSVASQAVSSAFEGARRSQMVRDWLERKFRNKSLSEYLADEKHVASVYRKLRYAGFSSSSAIRVLREYSSRASDLEDAPDENASEQSAMYLPVVAVVLLLIRHRRSRFELLEPLAFELVFESLKCSRDCGFGFGVQTQGLRIFRQDERCGLVVTPGLPARGCLVFARPLRDVLGGLRMRMVVRLRCCAEMFAVSFGHARFRG